MGSKGSVINRPIFWAILAVVGEAETSGQHAALHADIAGQVVYCPSQG